MWRRYPHSLFITELLLTSPKYSLYLPFANATVLFHLFATIGVVAVHLIGGASWGRLIVLPNIQLKSGFLVVRALGKASAMGQACNAVKDDIENVWPKYNYNWNVHAAKHPFD